MMVKLDVYKNLAAKAEANLRDIEAKVEVAEGALLALELQNRERMDDHNRRLAELNGDIRTQDQLLEAGVISAEEHKVQTSGLNSQVENLMDAGADGDSRYLRQKARIESSTNGLLTEKAETQRTLHNFKELIAEAERLQSVTPNGV